MGIAYFIPQCGGLNLLKAIGRGDAFAPGWPVALTEVGPEAGPAGLSGVVIHAGGAPTLPRMHWEESLNGKFWLGWPEAAQPGPASLRRSELGALRGTPIRMGDGHEWIIPLVAPCTALDAQRACTLPRSARRSGRGRTWVVDERYDELRFLADCFARDLEEGRQGREAIPFVVELLGVNYRVREDEALALGLLSEASVEGCILAAIDGVERGAALAAAEGPAALQHYRDSLEMVSA